MMPGRTRDLPNRLVVVRADGDVLIDPDVNQEHGLLESRPLGISFPKIQQAVAYGWVLPNQRPTKQGGEFVVAHEPPHAEEQSRFINEGMKAVYRSHFEATSHSHMKKKKELDRLKFLWIALCVATIISGMIILPFIVAPQMNRGSDPAPVTTPPPPAQTPFPTPEPHPFGRPIPTPTAPVPTPEATIAP